MPTKIRKEPIGRLVKSYMDCIELWHIGADFYQLVEIRTNWPRKPFGKVFQATGDEARRRAYDIACVESDVRHEFPD
jgi:hypothetical protein